MRRSRSRDFSPPWPPDDVVEVEQGSLAVVRRQMERRLAELRTAMLDCMDDLEGLVDSMPGESSAGEHSKGSALPCRPPRRPRSPLPQECPPAPTVLLPVRQCTFGTDISNSVHRNTPSLLQSSSHGPSSKGSHLSPEIAAVPSARTNSSSPDGRLTAARHIMSEPPAKVSSRISSRSPQRRCFSPTPMLPTPKSVPPQIGIDRSPVQASSSQRGHKSRDSSPRDDSKASKVHRSNLWRRVQEALLVSAQRSSKLEEEDSTHEGGSRNESAVLHRSRPWRKLRTVYNFTTAVRRSRSNHTPRSYMCRNSTLNSKGKLQRSGSAMPTSVSSGTLSQRVRAAYYAGGSDVQAAVRRRNALMGSHKMGSRFELIFGGVILLNAVLSGVEVQHKAVNIGVMEPYVFQAIHHVFTLIFLLEMVLRVRKLGYRMFFCQDDDRAWAWLDALVVVGGVFELLLDVVMYMLFASDSSLRGLLGDTEGSGLFRNVRLIRLVRLTHAFRLQRIIRFIAALRTLVYSIAHTLKSLFWAMVLLAIIVYIFSLAFTHEALDALESGDRAGENPQALGDDWGTLFRSMYTLFQCISGGVSWRDVIGPLADASRISSFLFTVYISFTTFAVLNVVTGVFCSSALEATQRNPDLVARNILDKRRETSRLLENLFTAIDDDDSGLITLDELHAISEDDMVRAYFQAMDIDFRDAWTLFKLIDSKNAGEVPLQEFLLACEQLKGGATNMHVSELSYDIRKLHMNVCKLGRVVKDRLPDVPGGSTEPLHDRLPTDDDVSAL